VSERVDPVEATAQESLGELYRAYSTWLRRRLRRLVGPDQAEDLVQETYLRLARYGCDGDVAHPKALLLRIAVNLSLDAHRRERRHSAARAALPAREPADAPAQTQALLLKQVILDLPEPLREVFLLSRFGGLTNAQIGERLGLSVKTVEWRMSKALARCAAQLRS
jgi:RNA polymerase sigma-70 factor (ECF subfamily)